VSGVALLKDNKMVLATISITACTTPINDTSKHLADPRLSCLSFVARLHTSKFSVSMCVCVYICICLWICVLLFNFVHFCVGKKKVSLSRDLSKLHPLLASRDIY
jgi:hypothetical protein